MQHRGRNHLEAPASRPGEGAGRRAKRGVPRDLSLPPGASGKGMQVGLKGGAQGLATAPWCARGRLPQRGLPGAWQLPRLESEACT